MTTDNPPMGPLGRLAPLVQENLKKLKDAWLWFVILGGSLMFLGVLALSYSAFFTIATVEILGFFLIIGASLHIGGAFFTGSWGGFFLTLGTGVLQLVVGLMCVRHPAEAAIVYTLMMAVFFMVGGLLRIFAAASGRFHSRGWVLFNGVITLVLGIMIWQQSPFSGLWVIGTFLGIDLLCNGWSYLLIGLSVRKIPA